jgi:hypothetical protein
VDASILQPFALTTAFWVALFHFRGCPVGLRARGAVAFLLGAVFAHLGWCFLYGARLLEAPTALLAPTGFSVLFVPIGILIAVPWRAGLEKREEFLALTFGALPLSLAIARLGCLPAGCCGPPAAIALDLVGLVVLHGVIRRADPALIASLVAVGMGALRLAAEPLRDVPPLGEPDLPVWLVAATWVALGAGVALYRIVGGGLATSRAGASAKVPLRST